MPDAILEESLEIGTARMTQAVFPVKISRAAVSAKRRLKNNQTIKGNQTWLAASGVAADYG